MASDERGLKYLERHRALPPVIHGQRSYRPITSVVPNADIAITRCGTLSNSIGDYGGFGPNDNWAGFNNITTGVAAPEPATWVMMVVGFGTVGVALRRRQQFTIRYA